MEQARVERERQEEEAREAALEDKIDREVNRALQTVFESAEYQRMWKRVQEDDCTQNEIDTLWEKMDEMDWAAVDTVMARYNRTRQDYLDTWPVPGNDRSKRKR